MALGKNMKVEKLIPLETKEEVEKKPKAKLEPKPLVEDSKEVKENPEEIVEAPNNVDLDAFFDGLENTSNEVSNSPVSAEEEVPKEEVIEVKPEEPIAEPSVKKEADKKPVYEDVESETLKIVFKPSRRKTQKRIFIEIEGAMTINNVEVLHSKVNEVFEKFDHVELNMSNITEIDLTVIQLFHTIRMTYMSMNKFVYINAEFSRDDRKLLNACGFTEFQTQKPSAN